MTCYLTFYLIFSGERPFNCDVCFRKFTLKHSMLRHRKKHSNALNHMNNFQNNKSDHGELNGNGSSINNSASDMSDDESSTLAMINNKKLREMLPQESSKVDHDMMSRMMNPLDKELFQKLQEKFFSMQQQSGSDLLSNLLCISDQGVLNKIFNSSPDEAATLLGVKK